MGQRLELHRPPTAPVDARRCSGSRMNSKIPRLGQSSVVQQQHGRGLGGCVLVPVFGYAVPQMNSLRMRALPISQCPVQRRPRKGRACARGHLGCCVEQPCAVMCEDKSVRCAIKDDTEFHIFVRGKGHGRGALEAVCNGIENMHGIGRRKDGDGTLGGSGFVARPKVDRSSTL